MMIPAQSWTTEMTVFFISAIPIFVMAVLLLREYFRKKYRHLLYMGFAWVFATLWLIIQALSYYYMSIWMYLFSVYLIIPMAYLHLFALDFMTQERLDLWKIFILTVVATIFVVYSLTEVDAVIALEFPSGEKDLSWNDNTAIFGSILSLMTGLFIVYYAFKIFRHSPKSVRLHSGLYLLGGMIIGVITPIVGLFNFHWQIPGFAMPMFTFGIILCAIALLLSPQLAYIIPFKAIRLSIINTQSGLSLYTHHWAGAVNTEMDARFTGMMHGISAILNHSLGKGNVNEIQLEKASLLLQRSTDLPVVCVLIATKTSQSLRDGLKNFSTNFFKQFSPYIQNSTELDPFKEVVSLVEHCFPFIPEY